MQEFMNQIKQIPFYQDASFKQGNRSALANSTSTVHFVVYPLLAALGYSVYSPDTVKIQDMISQGNLDVGIHLQNKRIIGFFVRDYANYSTVDALKTSYLNQSFGTNRNETPLAVITNGVDFTIFSGKTDIVSFDLSKLDEQDAPFVYKALSKDSQSMNLTNPKFLDELILESQFGNLRHTEFLRTALLEVLKTPDNGFLEMISRKIYDANCSSLAINVIQDALVEELATAPSMLFDMLSETESTIPVAAPPTAPAKPYEPQPAAPFATFKPEVTPPPVVEIDSPTKEQKPSNPSIMPPIGSIDPPKTQGAEDPYKGLISTDDDDDDDTKSLEDLLKF